MPWWKPWDLHHETLRRYYLGSDRSPVYAWKAMRLHLEQGMPLPGWAREYFLESSTQIDGLGVETRRDGLPLPAEAVSEALGFSGAGHGRAGSAWQRARLLEEALGADRAVRARMRSDGVSRSQATGRLAGSGDGFFATPMETDSLVKKLHRRLKKIRAAAEGR